jgi:hypothetical protein
MKLGRGLAFAVNVPLYNLVIIPNNGIVKFISKLLNRLHYAGNLHNVNMGIL